MMSLLMLFATLSLSATIAASVSATELTGLQWLFNGEEVKTSLNASTEIETLFEDRIIGAKAVAKCSEIQVETVGAQGAGEVKEVLNLSKEAISLIPLSGLSLSCEGVENCTSPQVWIVNLPWITSLGNEEIPEKETLSTIADLKGSSGNPGWYIECTILGIKVTDECADEVLDAEAKNVASGVEAIFSKSHTEELALPLATCSQSKEATGTFEGKGTVKTSEGGTLSVSQQIGKPQVDVSEYPIEFGRINSGESRIKELTLANLGPGAWPTLPMGVRMDDGTFLIVATNCEPTIAESTQCFIQVAFSPQMGMHDFNGELYVGNLGIPLRGQTN